MLQRLSTVIYKTWLMQESNTRGAYFDINGMLKPGHEQGADDSDNVKQERGCRLAKMSSETILIKHTLQDN